VAAAGGCHHADPSSDPILAGADTCDDVVLDAPAFLQEQMRRDGPFPAGEPARVSRASLAQLTTASPLGRNQGLGLTLEKRPLAAALRI
jgi:hypothetical protein